MPIRAFLCLCLWAAPLLFTLSFGTIDSTDITGSSEGERIYVAEFYNAFNHTHLPGADSTARFDASPRGVQLSLRLMF